MADITYEKLKEMLKVRNIPILTLDKRWYDLVPEAGKTQEIKYWENEVNELLKKQGKITNDLADIKKIKSQLMQQVVEDMEGEPTPKHQKKMNENQRLIYEAKDKIDELEDEQKDIPRALAQANEKLLAETAKFCYEIMNDNRKDLEVLDKWINATRIKLKKNLLIKQDKESINEKMYSGLHDIVGPEVIETLDRINETGPVKKEE